MKSVAAPRLRITVTVYPKARGLALGLTITAAPQLIARLTQVTLKNAVDYSPASFMYHGLTMKKQTEFPKTLQQAIIYFSDADNASNFLSQLRWPDGVECPECSGRELSY